MEAEVKIDLYTKVVLTGIFGCLLWLCVNNPPVSTTLNAQLGPTPVVIAGYTHRGSTEGIERGLPVVIIQPGQVPSAPSRLVTPPPANVPPTRQAVPPTRSPTESVSVRCQATTQKGAQCKRTAKAGSSYCWQHGG